MELGPLLRALWRNNLRFVIVSLQVAITLAIVVNCVSLIGDARRRMTHPQWFDEENAIGILLPTPDAKLNDIDLRERWRAEMADRLRKISGVQSVSLSLFTPYWGTSRGFVKSLGAEGPAVAISSFFTDAELPKALGFELAEGKWFSEADVREVESWVAATRDVVRALRPDGKASEPIVIDCVITRALGRRIWGEGSFLGKVLEDVGGDHERVIGVIGDYYAPTFTPIDPSYAMFCPGTSIYAKDLRAVVRAEPGQAISVVGRIQESIAEIVQTSPHGYHKIFRISEARDLYHTQERMTVSLMGALIVLLLFVAALGIAGLASYSVTQRTRQIGIRRAIGATTNDILRYFLTEMGIVSLVGLAVGSGLSVPLNMFILRFYDGAKLDVGIVAACALLLLLVALGSALPPALRASKISPAIATRNV